MRKIFQKCPVLVFFMGHPRVFFLYPYLPKPVPMLTVVLPWLQLKHSSSHSLAGTSCQPSQAIIHRAAPFSQLRQSWLRCQLVAQASSSHPKWHPSLFIMNMTPPPTNPSLPKHPGTPVHTFSTTTDWFYQFKYRLQTFSHLIDEIEPFLVGPILVEIFLELFLPSSSTPPFTNGMFNALVQLHSQCETSWYDVFVSSVLESSSRGSLFGRF